jgi:hypothetical protein
MGKLPEQPFLTADFSPTGGGIDFLGLRWVNPTLLAERLIPGINNATSDFGIYCLATWIPWKFQQLCTNPKDYVLTNFRAFEEAVGVAISHTMRPGSPSAAKYGKAHGKIGVQQKLDLPSELSFDAASRTRSTSIYAAPLYGPSLRYLGLLQGRAIAEDGTSTEIPLAGVDKGSILLAETVNRAVSKSDSAGRICRLDRKAFEASDLDDLGLNGLNPAFYRLAPVAVKRAFLKKLTPAEESNGRTLTARLMIETLKQQENLDLEELRAVWHTGLFPDGAELQLQDERLARHRELWAIFQSRQYQRYIIELFMKCFELALQQQLSSIDDMSVHVTQLLPGDPASRPLREYVMDEARLVSSAQDLARVSVAWRQKVNGNHPAYVWIPPETEENDCRRAVRMLARWWLRTLGWLDVDRHRDLFLLGGEGRVSIKWFFDWVRQRFDQPLQGFVKDVFEQLVFGQHIRIALSRFDGQRQRLRFVLGDEGIIPTRSAANKLGESLPGWTADRLHSFTGLLTDLSVLTEGDEGRFSVGALAAEVQLDSKL